MCFANAPARPSGGLPLIAPQLLNIETLFGGKNLQNVEGKILVCVFISFGYGVEARVLDHPVHTLLFFSRNLSLYGRA